MKQRTIAKEISIKGIGLHTGKKCGLILKPAMADTGILFKLKGSDIIVPALLDYVSGGIRGTSITKDGITFYTIEHLLATLYAYKIDNIIVEMSSFEPPIGDGSADIFVSVIEKIGTEELEKQKDIFMFNEEIIYENQDVVLKYIPDEYFIVECTIDYRHPVLGKEYLKIEINEDNFKKEIARARTFCFDYEIEHLHQKGLAKGGSFENAIIIGEKGLHNPPLRFDNEFVRHKILDLIGDISLLGKYIKGRIVAYKCGHRHNMNFARLLHRRFKEIKV